MIREISNGIAVAAITSLWLAIFLANVTTGIDAGNAAVLAIVYTLLASTVAVGLGAILNVWLNPRFRYHAVETTEASGVVSVLGHHRVGIDVGRFGRGRVKTLVQIDLNGVGYAETNTYNRRGQYRLLLWSADPYAAPPTEPPAKLLGEIVLPWMDRREMQLAIEAALAPHLDAGQITGLDKNWVKRRTRAA